MGMPTVPMLVMGIVGVLTLWGIQTVGPREPIRRILFVVVVVLFVLALLHELGWVGLGSVPVR